VSDEIPELPSLVVVGGPLDGYELKISPGTTVVVGSGRLAQLRVDHPEIELAHVKVTWDDLGISMIDNGSRHGTWVNGEPVVSAALLDGDRIEFTAPGSKSQPPRIKMRIPKGAVPEPPPPAEPLVPEAAVPAPAQRPSPGAARRPAARRAARRRSALPFDLPDLRLLGLGLGAFLLVFGGAWIVKWLFLSAPQIVSIQPAEAEPGATVTLAGTRFSGEAGKNVVWFGDRSSPASAVAGQELQVKVPAIPQPGRVSVSVETPHGRSGRLPFVVATPLEATALDPPGAVPGDEVILTGRGFADGQTSVSVGGVEAKVIATEPTRLRFEMPRVGDPGSRQAVTAAIGGRRTRPLELFVGRVPLVLSFDPARAVAGDVVRIRGVGFAATPAGNRVTFDGVPALVVGASSEELVVVAPLPVRPQPETLAQVVVQAGGRTSSDGASYPLLRLVEGAWILRFLAQALPVEGGSGLAVVGTEIAPVLVLADKDDARSVGERALRVARELNAAVDRARVGREVAFEARPQPVGVAVAGSPDLIARVTAQDAAFYEAPPGLVSRGSPPSPSAVADYWAALLNDYLVIATSASAPRATAALSTAGGAAMSQLRAALPFQFGSGIRSQRVTSLSADLRQRLRAVAFRVP
jgi:hypothetical protein